MSSIGILGAGTWGMALARMLANDSHEVTIWSALSAEIDELSQTRKHKNLPYMDIPESIWSIKDKSVIRGHGVLNEKSSYSWRK